MAVWLWINLILCWIKFTNMTLIYWPVQPKSRMLYFLVNWSLRTIIILCNVIIQNSSTICRLNRMNLEKLLRSNWMCGRGMWKDYSPWITKTSIKILMTGWLISRLRVEAIRLLKGSNTLSNRLSLIYLKVKTRVFLVWLSGQRILLPRIFLTGLIMVTVVSRRG